MSMVSVPSEAGGKRSLPAQLLVPRNAHPMYRLKAGMHGMGDYGDMADTPLPTPEVGIPNVDYSGNAINWGSIISSAGQTLVPITAILQGGSVKSGPGGTQVYGNPTAATASAAAGLLSPTIPSTSLMPILLIGVGLVVLMKVAK